MTVPSTTLASTVTPDSLADDDPFGVVVHTTSSAITDYFLQQMGVTWYLDFGVDMSQVPDGTTKLPFITIPSADVIWTSGQAESIESLTDGQIAALGFPTRAELQGMATSSPGSYWYLFEEPNRYGYMTGKRFAPVFHYLASQLTTTDPTAKIIGPSVLNWDFVCVGCGGYQSGEVWLKEFIGEYSARYGSLPQVYAWAIDAYPIDWSNTPNNRADRKACYNGNQVCVTSLRFLHSEIAIKQLERMRVYLDANGYGGTPIWVTKIAIQVGYESWRWVQFPTKLEPVGSYDWVSMSNYVNTILDWLQANGATNKIERWFFYVTWQDIVNVGSDGYMGTIFFDGPGQDASLNCLGETYRAMSLSLPRASCDASEPPPKPAPTPAPALVPSLGPRGLAVMGLVVAFLFVVYTGLRSRLRRPVWHAMRMRRVGTAEMPVLFPPL